MDRYEMNKILGDIDKEILSKCNLDAIEHEINESESVTDKIINCKQCIQEALREPSEMPTLSAGPPVHTANSNQPKLPKLTLPKFRGDLTSWTSFWDSFKSTVHDNDAISKVDKFSYLKLLLEGTAARSIQGLTSSETNYNAAISLLQERPQQIITEHMEELLQIQGCLGDRPSSLRSVFDKIMVHV